MREPPDLEVVNRTLGEVVRKQEQDIILLRQAVLVAAGALRVAGYHTSAEAVMRAWEQTAT